MLTFRKITEDDLELILEWRTSEHVTKYMYTDIDKNIDNQRRWFDRISNDSTQCYWMIHHK
ncbi:MAG TPA: GNAT family N-acetyltransferase [Candidatus Paenibacillus intestinavium]|nr:GNAT family N-acetyltransferase [Candidatus Paenibacillus intestinavium]